MPSNECWGIEVGAGAIKALKLASSDDGVEVVDIAMIPHKKVLSTPDLDQVDATRVALGTLTSQLDLSGANIAVSVPGHAAFARFAKLPPVDPKDVPKIVRFEAVQQIPFPIEDVEWDFQTFKSPDTPDVEVGIFAITRERIMQTLAQLSDVGIVPDIVTLGPIAAFNGVSYDLAFDDETPGTIILDVGTTSTDLLISEPGRVWVRTFPIGGHHFTEALVEKFKLSYAKAERLKKEAEKSQHARHVFQAMRPVFADLAQDVQRSIGYYQSLHPDAKLVRLIGLGSTFQIPGLRKYLKQQLQLHVYRLEGFKRLGVEGPRAADLAAHSANFATAYGLALQGLGMASLPANLMPVPVVRETLWQRKVKWFGLAAGISLAAGACMFIRPFLDSQAVAGAPRANIVPDTIRLAQSLKSDAGDVVSDQRANYDAANLISIADDRGVYANIVNDVGLILDNAQTVMQGWKGDDGQAAAGMPDRPFHVNSLTSQYKPVAGADSKPMIDLTLVVQTSHPEASKFVIESIDRWLDDNASRDGVPYRIIKPGGGRPAWSLVTESVAGGRPIADGRGMRTPGRDPGGRASPGGRQRVQEMLENEFEGQDVMVTGRPQRPQNQGPLRAATSAELEKIAPLPPPPPAFKEGATVSTFRVVWSVELLPEGGDS